MSIKPEISYIITVYNKEKHLADLFNIIKKQEIKNYEIIFIDDNSSDNSVKIIKSLSKNLKNVTLIENKDNKGPAIRLNEAAKQAKGEFFHLFDCDDIPPDGTSKHLLELARKHGADLIYGQYKKTYLSSAEIIKSQKLIKGEIEISENPLLEILKKNHTHINSLIKRETFIKSGGCNEKIFIQDESLALNSGYAATKMISLNYPTIFAPKKTDSNLSANLNQQHHDRFLAYKYALNDFKKCSKTCKKIIYLKAISTLVKIIKKNKLYKYYPFLFYYFYLKLAKPAPNFKILDKHSHLALNLVNIRKS
jgi:glycosyltransferase involved in cell wall biosynthesis